MARKQTTASQRQFLERTLSQMATWIQDLAPQAQVDITQSVSVVALRDESGVFSLVLKVHKRYR